MIFVELGFSSTTEFHGHFHGVVWFQSRRFSTHYILVRIGVGAAQTEGRYNQHSRNLLDGGRYPRCCSGLGCPPVPSTRPLVSIINPPYTEYLCKFLSW